MMFENIPIKDYELVKAVVIAHEGRRLHVYNPGDGCPTIGMGLNLNRDDAGSILRTCHIAHKLEDLKTGQHCLSIEEEQRLSDYIINESASFCIRDECLGKEKFSALNSAQQAAVISLATNSPRALKKVSSFIKNNNWNDEYLKGIVNYAENRDQIKYGGLHARYDEIQTCLKNGDFSDAFYQEFKIQKNNSPNAASKQDISNTNAPHSSSIHTEHLSEQLADLIETADTTVSFAGDILGIKELKQPPLLHKAAKKPLPNRVGGKKDRRLADALNNTDLGHLGQGKQRKQLVNAIADAKQLDAVINTLSNVGTVLDLTGRTLQGYNNIKESGQNNYIGYSTEAACRLGEYFAEKLYDGILTEVVIMIAGAEFAVPFIIAHTLADTFTDKITKKYTFTPAWEFIENNVKDKVQEWLGNTQDYEWEYNPTDNTIIGSRPSTSLPEIPIPQVAPTRAPTVDIPSEAKEVPVDNPSLGLGSLFPEQKSFFNDENAGNKLIAIKSPFAGEIFNTAHTIDYEYQEKENPIKTHWGVTQDKQGHLGIQAGVNIPRGSTTIAVTGEITGISNNNPGVNTGIEVSRHLDTTDTTVGVGAHFSMNKDNKTVGVSGSIAGNNTKVMGGLSMGTAGLAGVIGFSSAAPPVIAAVGVVFGVAFAWTGIKGIIDYRASKKAAKQAAKQAALHRQIAQQEAAKQAALHRQIVQQEAAKQAAINKQIEKQQAAMAKKIHEEQKNTQIMQAGAEKIDQSLAQGQIHKAREECALLQAQFPNDEVFKTLNKELHDENVLKSQVLYLLKTKGIEAAQQCFEESFSDSPDFNQHAYAFLVAQYQHHYHSDAKQNAEKLVKRLSAQPLLSEHDKTCKEDAHYLLALMEASKPQSEQSDEYLMQHLNQASPDMQVKLVEKINHDLDREKYLIYAKITQENNDSEKAALEDVLKYIHQKQYIFTLDQYEKNPKNDLFFKKMSALYAEEGNLPELFSLLDRELSSPDTPEDLTKNQRVDVVKASICDVVFLSIDHKTREALNNDILQEPSISISDLTGPIDLDLEIQQNYSRAAQTIRERLSCTELSAKEREELYFSLYYLINHIKIVVDSTKIIQDLKADLSKDPNNPLLADWLANEYCKQLDYHAAEKVWEEYGKSSSNEVFTQTKINQVKMCAIQMKMFGLQLLVKCLNGGTGWLKSSKYINNKVARIAAKTQTITHTLAPIIQLPLQLSMRHLASKNNALNPSTKAASNRQYLGMANMALSCANIGFSMYVSSLNEEEQKKLYYYAMGLDIGQSLGFSGEAVWSFIDPGKDFNPYFSGLNVVTPIGGLMNRWYYEPRRREGRAPTSTLGIMGEDIAALFDSTFVRTLNFVVCYNQPILYVVNLIPYAATAIGAVAAAGKATVAGVSAAAAGVGGTTLAVAAAGTFVVTGGVYYFCVRPYKKYYANKDNALRNINLARAHQADWTEVEENLLMVKKSIKKALELYPGDKEMMRISDLNSIYAITYNPEINDKQHALDIANQRLNENLSTEMQTLFRKARIDVLFKKMSMPNVTSDEISVGLDQGSIDSQWLIDQDPRGQEGWWNKISIQENKRNFVAATATIKNAFDSLIELSDKEKSSLNEIKDRILEKMKLLMEMVILDRDTAMDAFQKSLYESAGTLYPYEQSKGIPPGQIMWKNGIPLHLKENAWVVCKDAEKPQPGDLILNEENKLFSVAHAGAFRQLDDMVQHCVELAQALQENKKQMQNEKALVTPATLRMPHFFEPHKKQLLIKQYQNKEVMLENFRYFITIHDTSCASINQITESLKKVMLGMEEQNEKLALELDKQLTPEDIEQIKAHANEKISEILQTNQQTLSQHKKNIESEQKKTGEYAAFSQMNQEHIAYLESCFNFLVQRNMSLLYERTVMDVFCNLIVLFSHGCMDAVGHHRTYSHPTLPNWSHALGDNPHFSGSRRAKTPEEISASYYGLERKRTLLTYKNVYDQQNSISYNGHKKQQNTLLFHTKKTTLKFK